MGPGDLEFEVITTARVGREDYYSRLDHRLEFETGLTEKLQTAFYLNWSQVTADNGAGELGTAYSWGGFSSEFKYKFTDPVADPLGFALYEELGYNTYEIEIELKTLFDKNLAGGFFLVANLVGELEFEVEAEELELEEIGAEARLALGYALSPKLSFGLELRNHNEIEKEIEEKWRRKMEKKNSNLKLPPFS